MGTAMPDRTTLGDFGAGGQATLAGAEDAGSDDSDHEEPLFKHDERPDTSSPWADTTPAIRRYRADDVPAEVGEQVHVTYDSPHSEERQDRVGEVVNLVVLAEKPKQPGGTLAVVIDDESEQDGKYLVLWPEWGDVRLRDGPLRDATAEEYRIGEDYRIEQVGGYDHE